MEVQISEKKENKLLDRIEVRFTLVHDGEKTPTRDQIKKAVSEAVGKKAEQTVIERCVSEFGRGASRGVARVYNTVDQARKIEAQHLQKRMGIFVEKKKPGDKNAKKEGGN